MLGDNLDDHRLAGASKKLILRRDPSKSTLLYDSTVLWLILKNSRSKAMRTIDDTWKTHVDDLFFETPCSDYEGSYQTIKDYYNS